jgi:hypothetical protein
MAPMVINAGVRKLEQSFYYAETGQNARNANTKNEQRANSNEASRNHGEKNIPAVVNKIVGLLENNRKKKERKAIEKLI